MKGTIYYLIPDLHSNKIVFRDLLIAIKRGRPFDYIKCQRAIVHKPVGGIKVFYQHCLLLKELGYKAYPLVLGDYVGNFFGYDLELKYLKDVGHQLQPDDIVVSTEFTPYDGLKFKNAKKVLFMQNWTNIGQRFKKADIGKSYLDLGYDQVITCGDYCSEMVNKLMNIPAFTITNGIDQEKFFPIPERRVPGRVLALSRKKAADLASIMAIVKDHNIEFKVVDKLTQSQLIEEYQQADIFLATGYPEGLPLPPLEAMNCGCAVVGFTGGGAKEYMIDRETALVAEDGDCATAASKLLELLNNPPLKETIRANGTAVAQKYTLENTKQKIAEFYAGFN
jgi:glycosyltransferase involved in cell wall biosynthesis